MTGVPIYLVSACSTGEEFVAAFRRYADRGSLFVPIAEPIPAGRRGRFALTLAGGGVLIEGDAEVISSSKVASVLHGRVGMTIRFADLEEPSKSVLVELEKARLVAKPPAPSVSPRMVELPDGPRPKPPAPSVRIDASVALAECTALGDIEALEKSVAAPPKAGPKFVVPSVPPVGAPRPNTPSSVPEPRPRMPSGPQPVIARPKTPSVPPSMPALSPLPKSPSGPTKLPDAPTGFSATMPAVQIGEVAREKVPLDVALRNASKAIEAKAIEASAIEGAKTEAMDVPPAPFTPTEMSAVDGPKTTTMDVPPVTTMTPTEMAAVPPPPGHKSKDWMLMTVRSAAPPPPTPAPPIVGTPPPKPALDADLDEPTDLTAMPIIPEVDDRKTSLGMPPMLAEDDRKTSLGMPPMLVEDSGRKTRIGLPITREPAKPRPPTDDDAPVEIVDTLPAELDSKPTAIDESADTSVTEQPPELSSRVKMPVRPPGQPTVEEPTPSGDWTITPGGDKPTITPRKPGADQTDELKPVAQAADDEIKPPDAPARVTGNWTIQLDPTSSDGWSEPSKVDATALPDPDKPKKKKTARTKPTPETPPELRPVARSIIMEALPPAPKEPVTPSEEPKVQIDPTLMEAPIIDPNYGAPPAPPPPATLSALMPVAVAPSSPQIPVMPEPQAVPIVEHMRLATPVPGTMAPMMPIDRPTPSPIGIDPRVTPLPGTLMAPSFTPPQPVSPANLVAIPTPPPGRLVTDGGVGFFRDSGEIANLSASGSYPVGDSTSLVQARRRTRMLVIGISAGVVVAVGIVLVIMFAGGKKDDVAVETPDARPVSPPQNVKVVTPDAGEVAVQPKLDAADAAVVEPPKPPECSVEVVTVPPQAEVLLQGSQDVLATTPAKIPLPCGLEARILVRKQRFGSVIRPVTPTESGESIRVTLAKLMFSVKLSSTPAGAAISVNGGKSVAFTPTTMKLPAFELATITFTKDGFAVDTQKVTPKQNNQTLHSVLKKKPRR